MASVAYSQQPGVRFDIQSGQWRAAPINHPVHTNKGEGPAMSLIGCRDTIIWVISMCVCVSEAERGKNACRQRMNRTLRRRQGGGAGAGAAGGGRPKTQCGSKRTPSGCVKRWRLEGGVWGVQGGGWRVVGGRRSDKSTSAASVSQTRPQHGHLAATSGAGRGGEEEGVKGGGHHSCSPPPLTPFPPSSPLYPPVGSHQCQRSHRPLAA